MLVLVGVMTVGRGELTVVEWHKLLIPHDTSFHAISVMVAMYRWSGGAFIRRGELPNVGSIVDWPVGSGLSTGSSKVEPRLPIGSRGVVRHSSVGRSHVSMSVSVTAAVVGVRVVALWHTVLRWTHVWASLRSIDFGKSIDVLQLRSSKVSVVSTSSTSVLSESTSSTTTSSTAFVATTKAERRVFTCELGLDALAVGGVSDRR